MCVSDTLKKMHVVGRNLCDACNISYVSNVIDLILWSFVCVSYVIGIAQKMRKIYDRMLGRDIITSNSMVAYVNKACKLSNHMTKKDLAS